MWTSQDLKLAELHRQKLESQADKWRKTRRNKDYRPNPALKRKR